MPSFKQASSRNGLTPLLSPCVNPPPWMKITKGVGRSELAFQRSSTLRSCGPYEVFATSGGRRGLACFLVFVGCAPRVTADIHTAATASLGNRRQEFMLILYRRSRVYN